MRRIVLLIFIGLAGYLTSSAQNSLLESFETQTFPPPPVNGSQWQMLNFQGPKQWQRSHSYSYKGSFSAFISAETSLGEDWLITPRLLVGSTDSLIFFFRLNLAGYSPDSLCIKVSVTDSAKSSFSTIAQFAEGINYPVNEENWQRQTVDLSGFAGQYVYIAFAHYNDDGDGLYIDDIYVGTPLLKNIETVSIDVGSAQPAGITAPVVTVRNEGSSTQTFNVTLTASDGYFSTKTVTGLAPNTSTQVAFENWYTFFPGSYALTAYSSLHGDSDNSNDTLYKVVKVFAQAFNQSWRSAPVLPAKKWAHGSVAYKSGPGANDTPYLVLISGGDSVYFTNTSVFQINTKDNSWKELASVPLGRTHAQAYYYGGKLFFIGGYATPFSPTNAVSIYDIASNSWSSGAPMLIAVGDYAGCQFRDSLIYVIGGFNGTADVNTVQIYNAKSNTWTTGTSFTGTAVAGARAAVANEKIVVAGGFSQVLDASLSQAFVGTINPSNINNISWTVIADFPSGAVTRLAGVGLNNSSKVLFAGGDPNGTAMSAQKYTWVFDVTQNTWFAGPSLVTKTSNVCNLLHIQRNDSAYLVLTGGYDGSSAIASNQWLGLLSSQVVLPVHLVNFDATLVKDEAILEWQIAEDGTGESYVVQKSNQPSWFTDIFKIASRQVLGIERYKAIDKTPYAGYTYYRLKMIHKDGSFNYSPIRFVLNSKFQATAVTAWVYPNPSKGNITLMIQNRLNYPQKLRVRIIDAIGLIVQSESGVIENSRRFNYSLRPGNYILQVTGDKTNWTTKVIVR